MQQFARKMWGDTGWGMPSSIALHLALAFLLLVRLPELSSPAGEQSVNVELVAPPPNAEEKPPEKPREAKKEQSRSQPQAFESAAARAEKEKPARPELPPAAPNRIDEPREQPETSQSSPAKAENAASEKPPETRAMRAELRVDAEDGLNRAANTPPAPQTAAIPQEKPVPAATADEPRKAEEAATERQAKKLVEAQELYSGNALSDPRVKQALGRLPPKKRILQLCSIEALEQVRRQRPDAFPDMLVPFGPTGGFISAAGLSASGGAFRSRAKWYEIDFKCEVNTETNAIASFSFALGGAIPASEWSARQLPKE
ncbi:hypothetical protein M728_004689 (plasmid) [Ensifer sp. WSM1721]|uniref:DUF930 domain-containing protein n=1 Tax=Ensifer sp. WSM1721 TaxID=1041159 RepID=UPI0012EB567E|nr:DUF930 domain-containing protein [Ensifer sp. WSM1721]